MTERKIIPPPWLAGNSTDQPQSEQLQPETESQPEKRVSGKWYKGMPSPNPKGRKPGLKDRRLSLTTTMVENAHEVLKVVVEKALKGDMHAAGLLLSRCSPTLKPQSLPIQFDLDIHGSATEQAARILEAVAKGEMPPDVGNSLIDSISKVYGVKQIEELEERITALEGSDGA